MDTLMSRMPDPVAVSVVVFLGDHFATPVTWNPQKLQLPEGVSRLLVDEDAHMFHPENSPLAILATFLFLHELELFVALPETVRRFTAALVQLCAIGDSRFQVLHLCCYEENIEEQTQNGIIEDLRLLVPGLTEARFVFDCPSLTKRVIEEVLPLGKSVRTLKFKLTTLDELRSLLAAEVFPVLRELHLFFSLSEGFFIEDPNMHILADAIRSHASLRSICIQGGFGVATQLLEGILANPTIVNVEYVEPTSTMTNLLMSISPEEVVYARNIQCWDSEEHGLLLRVFPRTPTLLGWFNQGIHDKAIELVSPADLAMFAAALRSPSCALRNICAIVAPRLETSADDFFAAVKESTSLRSLVLLALPSAAPVVNVLGESLCLKEFGWIGDLDISGGGQHEALIDAAVANDTIESYYFEPETSLWSCVSKRNLTLCVKRTRLLWISWASEWVDHGRFESALVFETIQMADLGWSEADRLNYQLAYERDIPTNLKDFKKACRSPRRGHTQSSEKKCCCS